MIKFFNGHERRLGAEGNRRAWAQIDADFREYLSCFKGARLAIFLAIALHADADGWSWPSVDRMSQETGYDDDTIRQALADLCKMDINGNRVLLKGQPRHRGGQWANNHYLIFPTPEDVKEYEVATSLRVKAGKRANGKAPAKAPVPENPVTAGDSPSPGFPVPVFPAPVFPVPENPVINQNHSEPEPSIDDDDAARARKIDSALEQAGIQNPTRLRLVALWHHQTDGADVVDRIVSATYDEFLLLQRQPGGRKIKSYGGLVVARLRGEFEERTGLSATDVSPPGLDAVRVVLRRRLPGMEVAP